MNNLCEIHFLEKFLEKELFLKKFRENKYNKLRALSEIIEVDYSEKEKLQFLEMSRREQSQVSMLNVP